MRKAWVYKRRNIKGWWVGWYEAVKKRAKALPSRALAKHFCQIKHTQLNSSEEVLLLSGVITDSQELGTTDGYGLDLSTEQRGYGQSCQTTQDISLIGNLQVEGRAFRELPEMINAESGGRARIV